MAGREWNDAQRDAIERAGGPLLVSAAAGSGKTTVLVERAVRLVTREENPLPADRLLILTFTNAAAAELRARIAARIEEAVRAAGHAPALLRQKMRIKRAFIGTMDAFCQQLVREHFNVADIPPDVEVADEAELAQLRRAALDETMEEMYADEAFERFAALYGRARSDEELEDAVLALYEFTRSLPEPDNVLAGFLRMAEDSAPLAETPWGRALLRFAAESAGAALSLADGALDAAEGDAELAPYLPMLHADREAFCRIKAAVDAADWDGAAAAVCAYEPMRLGRVKAKYESPEKEFVKKSRDEVKKIKADLLKNCFVCTEEEYRRDNEQAGPLTAALVAAARLFADKYMQVKLAARVLDFSDFLHIAYGLLVQNGVRTELAGRVSARYDAVMVDEFQDTNDLQDALYAALAGEGGEKLFCVGDVKQSIYRFRSANPGIFLAKKERWACVDEAGGVITLGHNYRSGAGVIDGVNHIFSRLMCRALGEVDYNEDERLLRGRGAPGEPAGVELCLVNDPDRRGDADYVAGRISQMVQSGYPVQDGDGTRPCEYGDFCIMLRTNGHMPAYVAALAARGIPVSSAAGSDFLTSPEVLPVIAALRAVSNPGDDVALCALMMGPLVRFTPDEMAALRLRQPKGGLFSALLNSDDEKTLQFLETLRFYRALAREMPAGRLCEELVERSGYLSAVAAMPGGAARRENLLAFIGWANASSAALRGGLAGFVRLLENAATPGAAGYKSVKGHVSLLTIHKSKGLEFPVCFLARAQHEFNKRELRSHVMMHQALGVGIDLRAGEVLYPTLQALAVRRVREREGLSEEMRVLYVALTRAKEKMVVSMPCVDPEKTLADAVYGGTPGAYSLSKKQHFAAWLLAAGPQLCLGEEAEPRAFTVRIADMEKPPEAGGEAYVLTSAPDAAQVAGLLAGFAKTPQRAELRGVPTKISVSQLAKQGMAPVRKRPSFMYKSGLTAAERGTAMHLFMQLADYAAARENPVAEAKRLVDGAYIGADVAAALDFGGIRRFFASPLAGRIAAAEQVLREYDFITGVPAGDIDAGLTGESANELVMVQGIADAVLVYPEHLEIVDYKTDHGKTAGELAAMYRRQLELYRTAIEKRLGLPVARLTLWSFDLGYEVEVG